MRPAPHSWGRFSRQLAEKAATKTRAVAPYALGGTLLLPAGPSAGYVLIQDEKIVKVTSPIENEVTHGHLCIKGRFGWEWVNRRE